MGAPTNAPSEPNKCCFGMQFTATLGLIGGKVYPIDRQHRLCGCEYTLACLLNHTHLQQQRQSQQFAKTPARVNRRRIKSEEIGG